MIYLSVPFDQLAQVCGVGILVGDPHPLSLKTRVFSFTMWETIRKFGVEYCDLPTMLWNVSFMLRALTLNIDYRYRKRIPAAFYFITAAIAASYFYVYMVSMVWFVAVRSRETGDLVKAMVVGSLGISSEIGTTKLMAMFFYRHKVRELVELYLDCNSLVKPGSRFAANLTKTLREVKKRAIFFWMVIVGNGVVYVVKPLLMPGRHLMEDSYIVYGLEPVFESPNYEIAFVLMTAGVIFTCYLPANISAFLIITTGYSEAQMMALSQELLQLWKDAELDYQNKRNHEVEDNLGSTYEIRLQSDKEDENKAVNEHVRQRLREIVKIHMTNINLVHHVEKVYRGSIAAEFLLLTFGIIVELLGRLENTYLQIPFALMQVGMDCFCGQRVIDASVVFENAVYACKWENFDVNNMKTVLLILQMSQKTLRLSAGGVTMLSFRSLASVIRIIYSGYTALRQFTM